MKRVTIAGRIACSLTLFSFSAVLIARVLGLFPDHRATVMQGRISLCEALAIQCSQLARQNDVQGIKQNMDAIRLRNSDVLSLALRNPKGRLRIRSGNHNEHWRATDASTAANVFVPITVGNSSWGTVEVAFQEPGPSGVLGWLQSPFVLFTAFVTGVNALVFLVWLKRVLMHLDPSRVVPARVRSALDTLAEGLLVLDDAGRIVLANRAFASTVDQSAEDLQGRKASDLAWKSDDAGQHPWKATLQHETPQVGVPITLSDGKQADRNFMVNAAPILDAKGKSRGVLASFDDVTVMETKKAELLEMLEALKLSRDKIREQNKQLQVLATSDPLTGCYNRRSFFEEFDKAWQAAQRYDHPLSCLMVDVDHFKSVNDNHGHAVGDEVLRKVSAALREAVRETDFVGRYGGEEFCILLPHIDIDEAAQSAERIRELIEALEFPKLSVTVSLGASSVTLGAEDPQALMDQADKCLYFAKRGGRNQVVRWDQAPQNEEVDESQIARTPAESGFAEPTEAAVSYQAAMSLLSALAYRDPETAAHSTRVADLCVSTARDLMSLQETYILEIAALLHDIGKIGVPDAILLKPGALTDEEWRIMNLHARMGVEIVDASFDCQDLIDIVRYHHAYYGGDPNAPQLPRQDEIPLGARIVSIADAYDAIISDRVYRKARSQEEAFAELRRNSGNQFDPQLVERLIEIVSSSDYQRREVTQAFSKELALSLGVQTEQLAKAVDEQDFGGIRALATHLEATARKYGVHEVETLASQLSNVDEDNVDLVALIESTRELIDLCSSTQKVHVTVDEEIGSVDAMRRESARNALVPA